MGALAFQMVVPETVSAPSQFEDTMSFEADSRRWAKSCANLILNTTF